MGVVLSALLMTYCVLAVCSFGLITPKLGRPEEDDDGRLFAEYYYGCSEYCLGAMISEFLSNLIPGPLDTTAAADWEFTGKEGGTYTNCYCYYPLLFVWFRLIC